MLQRAGVFGIAALVAAIALAGSTQAAPKLSTGAVGRAESQFAWATADRSDATRPDPSAGMDYRTASQSPGPASMTAASVAGSFSFTFSSPTSPWTASELGQLQSWTAPGSPVMSAVARVAGAPAQNITINVAHDPNMTVAGMLTPGSPQARMDLAQLRLAVFVHELNHAVHNQRILLNSIWEEGMARAAEDEELVILAQQGITDPTGDPDHDYTYDRYYDALNVPDIGPHSGSIWSLGEAALALSRYEEAGYAFGKLLIQKPAFLALFNASLFQQPNGQLSDQTLVNMASAAQPSPDGMPFTSWYMQQHIFDTNPQGGCRIFQRINQWTADFFCRDSIGLETPQVGALVTCQIYAFDGRLLHTIQATTASSGWIDCTPPGAALAGYSGRVKVVASASSPTGSATSTYYRQSGPESGVFGVVPNADTGRMTFGSPAGLFATFSVPVSNGAFVAPSLAAVRGQVDATYNGTNISGTRLLTGTRTFTKAASPYALIVEPPEITSISTNGAPTGSSVTINGSQFIDVSQVSFGSLTGTFSVLSSTQLTATVPNGAGPGFISVTTPWHVASSPIGFVPTLSITGISPTSGPTGTVVTLTGVGFTPSSQVKYRGSATSTTYGSATRLTATIPAAATAGAAPLTVTNTVMPVGTVTSLASFNKLAPTIASFAPASGITGSSVSINGSNLTGATKVTVNAKSATVTSVSATKIIASVPNGATVGKISVTTPGGVVTSMSNFIPTLSITGISPSSGTTGTTVTLNGVGFTSSSKVKFKGVGAATTVVSSTQLRATIPGTATSGAAALTVTNSVAPIGTVSSANNFTKT
jgi:hypothetical protein